MSYSESDLSVKQREMLKRERSILQAAEDILTNEGFLDMSMARIAQKSKCPRGTIYLHFASREDIVVALACQAWEIRLELMERGLRYPGPPRLRMGAVAEGVALFFSLYPQHFSILDRVTETICAKASPHRLEELRTAERASVDILRRLLVEAHQVGDLPTTEAGIEETIFALSALTTGGFALHQAGFVQATLQSPQALPMLWRALNVMADAYRWHPLSKDVDWPETMADIRRRVFPEETQRLYGPDAWYGDWGNAYRDQAASAADSPRSEQNRGPEQNRTPDRWFPQEHAHSGG